MQHQQPTASTAPRSKPQWQRLPSPPDDTDEIAANPNADRLARTRRLSHDKPFVLNEREFVICYWLTSSDYCRYSLLLWKYNSCANEWTRCRWWTKMKNKIDEQEVVLLTMNHQSNTLYLLANNQNHHGLYLVVQHLDTGTFTQNEWRFALEEGGFDTDITSKMIVNISWERMVWVHGVGHYFAKIQIDTDIEHWDDRDSWAGKYVLKHFVLDQNTGLLKDSFVLNMVKTTALLHPVFVPRLNCILMIQSGSNGCIWRFRLDDKKWRKIEEISIDFNVADVVLSANEKYVVMLGIRDSLFVLDMSDKDQYQVYKSDIGPPETMGSRYSDGLVLIGGRSDEMLVTGWIRKDFNGGMFRGLQIPVDIMEMIAQWFSEEELHYIHNPCDGSKYEDFVMTLKSLID